MIDSNKNIYDWSSYLTKIEEYLYSHKYTDSINNILKHGLEVFIEIPNVESGTIFLTNSNLEFEPVRSLPLNKKNVLQESFECELDKGTVGMSIDTSKVILSDVCKKNYRNLIIPLSVSDKTIGLVFLMIKNTDFEINHLYMSLLSLHGGLFASIIENSKTIKDKERIKSILEQKVAERTIDLEHNKRELNAILDSVHTAILVIDEDTNSIIKSNPVAEKLLGLDNKNINNIDIEDFLDNYEFTKSYDLKNYECDLKNSNGIKIPILRTTSFMKYSTKKYRIESFLDITDIKNVEKKLQEANELLELKVEERTFDLQLLVNKLTEEIKEREHAEKEIKKMLEREKELNELKSRFVAMISHEFRTPLTVIKSSSQILNRFDSELSRDEKNHYLQRIAKTVDNMTQLIDNAIFISKSEKESVQLQKNNFDLEKLINEVITDVMIVLNKNREVNTKFEGNCSSVNTDEKLMRLVLTNLISNALKYSDDDKCVDVYCYTDEKYLKVDVKDYGIGIPEEDQEQIFNLFFRANNVGNIPGTGLGMTVIIESLKMLNGKLNLDSESGIGSKFSVNIPLRD